MEVVAIGEAAVALLSYVINYLHLRVIVPNHLDRQTLFQPFQNDQTNISDALQ